MAENTDYMSDGETGEAPPAEAKPETDSPKTAILPIAFFQGKEPQPGDTCEVTVEAVHDGSVEVSYHSSETSGQEKRETETGMEQGEEAGQPSEMEY